MSQLQEIAFFYHTSSPRNYPGLRIYNYSYTWIPFSVKAFLNLYLHQLVRALVIAVKLNHVPVKWNLLSHTLPNPWPSFRKLCELQPYHQHGYGIRRAWRVVEAPSEWMNEEWTKADWIALLTWSLKWGEFSRTPGTRFQKNEGDEDITSSSSTTMKQRASRIGENPCLIYFKRGLVFRVYKELLN